MDLSYEDDIDTLCAGCGGDAAGWTFSSDGRRVYVCEDCAGAIDRYDETDDGEPHPRGQLCRTCSRLTHLSDLNHQRRCPDCEGSAGDRAAEEARGVSEEAPPGVAAAAADAQGAVDWDEDE